MGRKSPGVLFRHRERAEQDTQAVEWRRLRIRSIAPVGKQAGEPVRTHFQGYDVSRGKVGVLLVGTIFHSGHLEAVFV
jgi:hypothetical protein